MIGQIQKKSFELVTPHNKSRKPKKVMNSKNIGSLICDIYLLLGDAVEFIVLHSCFIKVSIATISFPCLLYAFQVFNMWQERIATTRHFPDYLSNKICTGTTR